MKLRGGPQGSIGVAEQGELRQPLRAAPDAGRLDGLGVVDEREPLPAGGLGGVEHVRRAADVDQRGERPGLPAIAQSEGVLSALVRVVARSANASRANASFDGAIAVAYPPAGDAQP